MSQEKQNTHNTAHNTTHTTTHNTTPTPESIYFDPSDQQAMIALMDAHGDSKTMYPGTNDNGETVHISIFYDRIVVSTMQDNGWNRINTYWRDGTREETFDGKWR